MHIVMITNDTNFAWNLRREVLEALVQTGYEVSLIAHILDFKEEFKNMGVKVIDIENDRRGTNPVNDGLLLLKYLKVIKRIKPDIVFTNNIKPNVYAGIVCQLLNIKYCPNITGLGTPVENPGRIQKLSIFLYKTGVRKASAIFFQNENNLKFFSDHNMIPTHTHVVLLPGSGVNLDTHPVLEWPDGDIHFLFAARILKEKGIDYFLSAARKFASEGIVFDVCGQCDDKKYLELLANENSIKYHGLQRNMVPFYQQCSCFLYPSYYPEGMSNVLLEAAACGRPVIAANRAGCKEIVNHMETGYIVPIKNEDAVLKAVDRFLKLSKDEQKKMGFAGRKKIESEFDRKKVVKLYLDELERLKLAY